MVLAALDSLRIRDNTIIFFTSGKISGNLVYNIYFFLSNISTFTSVLQTMGQVWEDILGVVALGCCAVVKAVTRYDAMNGNGLYSFWMRVPAVIINIY